MVLFRHLPSPSPARPTRALPTAYHADDPALRRAAVALFAAGVTTFASLYSTQPLLPLLGTRFGVTPGQAALSVSLATAGIAVGLVLAGPLSELAGRTVVMHAGLAAAALLGLACAAAPTWHVLLALRLAQGAALAGLPAVAAAYLREEVEPRAYARVMGLYIAGTAIGGMSGRLISAALAEVLGWRGALAGIAAVGLTGTLVTRRLLPPSRRFVPAPARPRAMAAAWGRVLRDPVLLALYGIAGTLMGAFVAVYNVTGFRLEGEPYRLPVSLAGLVFAVYAFGSLGSGLGGRWAARVGQRPVVPAGAAIMAAGIALTLLRPLPGIVLGLAVMTFGFFVAHGVASGWVAARAQRHGATAQATAMYLLAYYAGSSLAGGVAGDVWTARGWPGVVALTLALTGAGLALAMSIVRSGTAGVRRAGDDRPVAPVR